MTINRVKVETTCPSCGNVRLVRKDMIRTAEKKGRTLTCRSCASKEPKDHSGPNSGRFVKDLSSPRYVALSQGIPRYQGKPCQHGHGTERYTKDGKCVACVAIRAKARAAKWAAKNRGRCAATAAKRRALKALATPAWLTQEDFDAMEALYIQAEEMTKKLGIPYEVDHIIPLQSKIVCGFHCPSNLRIVTRSENRQKCNKFEPLIVAA